MLYDMGFAYAAALLPADEYRQFESLQAARRCPASFLNQHARKYMLMIADPKLRAEIADGRPRRGDSVRLHGTTLRYAMGEVRKMSLNSFSFGDIVPVYVESLSLE